MKTVVRCTYVWLAYSQVLSYGTSWNIFLPVTFSGPGAPVDELINAICAAQMSREQDCYLPVDDLKVNFVICSKYYPIKIVVFYFPNQLQWDREIYWPLSTMSHSQGIFFTAGIVARKRESTSRWVKRRSSPRKPFVSQTQWSDLVFPLCLPNTSIVQYQNQQ